MNIERELLERWLDDTIFEPEELDSLMEETRELLAQPEQRLTPLTPKLISLGNNCHESFVKGIKFAEKMHGITGGDNDE
jgi:hypothetical protein